MKINLSSLSPDVLHLNPALAEVVKKGKQVKATAARPGPARGEFKNDYERAAYEWVQERALPQSIRYEKIMLYIPGGRYTPDFLFVDSENHVQCVAEVKGSRKMKNARAGLLKARAAAEVFWMWKFYVLTPAHTHQRQGQLFVDEWHVEEI